MIKFWRGYQLPGIVLAYQDWYLYTMDRLGKWEPKETVFRVRGGYKFLVSKKGEIAGADGAWRTRVLLDHVDLKDGDVVIDVGAHIGYFSVYAATQVRGAKVYAYEPCPDSYKKLLANIQLNSCKNIKAFELGVAGTKGQREFYTSENDNLSNSLIQERANGDLNEITIQTTTLKEVFDQNKIEVCNFLKMNAEGAEHEIIESTPVEYLKRIQKAAIFYHGGVRSLKDILCNAGFSVLEDAANGPVYGRLIAYRPSAS